MPAFFTAHAVRHALASAALTLGLLIVSAAAASAQQTTGRADTLTGLRAASTTHARQLDSACMVRFTLTSGSSPYDVWQCATASATAHSTVPTDCATAARWLAAPGRIGFMGLDYVSCESTTGYVPELATATAQRQLTMDRADYRAWLSLSR